LIEETGETGENHDLLKVTKVLLCTRHYGHESHLQL